MEKIKLNDFVEHYGPSEAAKLLGCSAPAILKALKSERDIYVTTLPDGTYEGKEIKDFPNPHHIKKTAA